MLLTHVCPICGRDHEMDCTPEPNQPCVDCRKKKSTKDPEEQRRDAQEILAEMKICPHCKEHEPCGCDGKRYGVMRNGQPVEKGIDTI